MATRDVTAGATWTAGAGLLLCTGAAFVLREAASDRALWTLLGPTSLVSLLGAVLVARSTIRSRTVLAVAMALRLVLATVPGLTLSDDLYRYLWDGRVAASGVSPYAYRPNDPALSGLRDAAVYPHLNSASYYSVYPPASQAVFRVAGEVELRAGSAWALAFLRGVGALTEMTALLLLYRLTRGRALFALYALSPLVLVEASRGHTELYALPLLVGAAWAVRRARTSWATAALSLAGAVKLVPFALVPLLWSRMHVRTSTQSLAVAVGIGLLVLAIVHPHLAHVSASLRLYTSYFEFNAGPYALLKPWLGERYGGDTGPLAARMLAATFLGGYAVAAVFQWWKKDPLLQAKPRHVVRTMGAVWLAFLATATTVHPWYLLPVLLLAVAAASPTLASATAWLAACAMGTYTHYTVGGDALWTVAGWTGAALILAISALVQVMRRALPALLRFRARGKVRALSACLPDDLRGLRVLDLGAGEGFVGEALARHGAVVTLADVADFHRARLPFVPIAEGEPLPFETDAFDLVVVVFVLHHSRTPEALMAEALRVGRRILVLESVFETERERRLLVWLDRWANRLRAAQMRTQEEHVEMRRAEDWERLARSLGADVQRFPRGGFPHRQALLCLTPAGPRTDPCAATPAQTGTQNRR